MSPPNKHEKLSRLVIFIPDNRKESAIFCGYLDKSTDNRKESVIFCGYPVRVTKRFQS